jgi:hypothetical protein
MRLVGKNEIPPPRSVFSANTHLGGRVQRPLVLFLYPRVGMHEFILLLHLFLSFWYHSRTWGGGGSMHSPRCAAPQFVPTTVCRMSPVFSPQLLFSSFFISSSLSSFFFPLLLCSPPPSSFPLATLPPHRRVGTNCSP